MAAMFVFGSGNLMAMPSSFKLFVNGLNRATSAAFCWLDPADVGPSVRGPEMGQFLIGYTSSATACARLVSSAANVVLLTASLTGTLWCCSWPLPSELWRWPEDPLVDFGHLDYAPPGQRVDTWGSTSR